MFLTCYVLHVQHQNTGTVHGLPSVSDVLHVQYQNTGTVHGLSSVSNVLHVQYQNTGTPLKRIILGIRHDFQNKPTMFPDRIITLDSFAVSACDFQMGFMPHAWKRK